MESRETESELRLAELDLIRGGLAVVWSHANKAACVSICRGFQTRGAASLYRQRPNARRAFRRMFRGVRA